MAKTVNVANLNSLCGILHYLFYYTLLLLCEKKPLEGRPAKTSTHISKSRRKYRHIFHREMRFKSILNVLYILFITLIAFGGCRVWITICSIVSYYSYSYQKAVNSKKDDFVFSFSIYFFGFGLLFFQVFYLIITIYGNCL